MLVLEWGGRNWGGSKWGEIKIDIREYTILIKKIKTAFNEKK